MWQNLKCEDSKTPNATLIKNQKSDKTIKNLNFTRRKKNLKCDKIQKLKMWQNKNKKANIKMWKAQNLKMWQNSKTENVTKIKNSKFDKTRKLNMWQKLEIKMW